MIGNRVYGCDDCQLVCPWNKFAQAAPVADFDVRHGLDRASLVDLFGWSADDFDTRMQGSAIRRIGYERWLRNLAVAMGNALRAEAGSRGAGRRSSTRCVRAPMTRQRWYASMWNGRCALVSRSEAMIYNAMINAPFGKVGIRTDASSVREIVYLPESTRYHRAGHAARDARRPSRFERYFDRGFDAFRPAARFARDGVPAARVAGDQRAFLPAKSGPTGSLRMRSAACRGRSGRRAARTRFRS